MVPRRMMDSPETKSCREGQGRQTGVTATKGLMDTEGTALLVPPAEGELGPKADVPWSWADKENTEYQKEPGEN